MFGDYSYYDRAGQDVIMDIQSTTDIFLAMDPPPEIVPKPRARGNNMMGTPIWRFRKPGAPRTPPHRVAHEPFWLTYITTSMLNKLLKEFDAIPPPGAAGYLPPPPMILSNPDTISMYGYGATRPRDKTGPYTPQEIVSCIEFLGIHATTGAHFPQKGDKVTYFVNGKVNASDLWSPVLSATKVDGYANMKGIPNGMNLGFVLVRETDPVLARTYFQVYPTCSDYIYVNSDQLAAEAQGSVTFETAWDFPKFFQVGKALNFKSWESVNHSSPVHKMNENNGEIPEAGIPVILIDMERYR